MRRNYVFFAILAILFCISCGRKQEDGVEAKNSIFRNNLLKGVSLKLDDYRKDEAFTVEETRAGPADPRNFPRSWYTAKNETIEIAFWPGRDAGEGEDLYRLQWADIKQKTTKYFLGQFIGMTRDELLKKYPDPGYIEDQPQGENHIMYYSVGGKSLVNFWLEDNEIVRVGFGYSVFPASSSTQKAPA